MNGHVASAIAALAGQINSALLNGHGTRELRAELAALEQQHRREDAERAAATIAADAERVRAEEEAQAAMAAALATAAEDRLRARLAALAPPSPPVIRRTPAGIHVIEDSER